ncbi:hypothetical protein M9Y10_000965 [Tritrichomonas musculus]|uniref:Uncharacterized protein n=1 Tax=Tritrichomonas musculus TaxID=1915356 RepID=A0ABR2L5P4_9EUKA
MLDFKYGNDCMSTRPSAIQETMHQLNISPDDKLLFGNYNLYTQLLFSYNENEEHNDESIKKLIDILNFFSEIFGSNASATLNILIQCFINDNTILKVRNIYLVSIDERIIIACLSVISNFIYQATEVKDVSCLFVEEVAFKMIGSIDSPVPDISKYTILAVCNLILENQFYNLVPCQKWYEIFVQLIEDLQTCEREDQSEEEETYNSYNSKCLASLRILYALLKNNYDPSKLVNHIEYASSLLIEYETLGSGINDPDIAYFALQVLNTSLSKNTYFNKEQIDQIISLFTPELIQTVAISISENENSLNSTSIIERLINFDIDIAPIFSYSSLKSFSIALSSLSFIIDESSDTTQQNISQIRINLLRLLDTIIRKYKWVPPPEFIYQFANIAENGIFEERKIAILAICNIGYEEISKFPDIYHILIDFLFNNEETIIVPTLNIIRNLLNCQQFVNYILSNQDQLDTLHHFVFNSDSNNIPECQEIILSINMMMDKIIKNSSCS